MILAPAAPTSALQRSTDTTSPIYRLRHLLSLSPLAPAYTPPVPNLELHSAAASGNVGLVHYALTHGQPINSVLHGVLPLHAACSGGSVSVVRMLIEQGADVNAPRLPRRYSDGKKGNAPSVGTAGSTPLHFAAANGHTHVVQMLLASGADPSKLDKNGHTPEDLALLNNSDQVVNVLHAHKRLANEDRLDGGSMTGSGSPTGSSIVAPSRKGKERAFSFSSNKSDRSLKIKKNLEEFLHTKPNRHSVASIQSVSTKAHQCVPPSLILRFSHEGSDTDKLASPLELDIPTSSLPDRKNVSFLHTNESTTTSVSGSLGGSLADLSRQVSEDSTTSQSSSVILSPPLPLRPSPARNHHSSASSRRPSLPSILEKAARPGAVFRAAIHGHHQENPRASSPTKSRSHKHGLLQFFSRRARSRSPSPPAIMKQKPMGRQELDKEIGRLERASLNITRNDTGSEDEVYKNKPNSAPVTKVTFFNDEFSNTTPSSSDVSLQHLQTQPLQPPQLPPRKIDKAITLVSTPGVERNYNRTRTGTDVIQPSPLANEWAESDSDGHGSRYTGSKRRRARTDANQTHVVLSSPGRSRSSTIPGSTTVLKGKDEDLRKVAVEGVIRKESEKRFNQEQNGDEEEVDDATEEWHDAVTTTPTEEIQQVSLSPVIELYQDSEASDKTNAKPSSSYSLASTGSKYSRIRSGSIGSIQSDTSRSPPSTLRLTTIAGDSSSMRHNKLGQSLTKDLQSRQRGRSVSSTSSGASGTAQSLGFKDSSTPSTSLTIPSILSVPASGERGSFPPVPEHEVMTHPPAKGSLTSAVISSHAEAQEAIKQSENEILELAQFPLNQESVRDLQAHLAVLGEKHEIERAFAEQETRETQEGKADDDGESWYTANTYQSRGSGKESDEESLRRKHLTKRLATPLTPMSHLNVPASANSRLSNIYDKRAAAYRDRLTALATLHLPHTVPVTGNKNWSRQRAASTDNVWLSTGPNRVRSASGGLSMGFGFGNGSGPYRYSKRPSPVFREYDVKQEQGVGNVERNSYISKPIPAMSDVQSESSRHLSSGSVTSHKAHKYTLPQNILPSASQSPFRHTVPSSTTNHNGLTPSSYVSIFSHRFSNIPLNDDDSDDEEQECRPYTIIENDWRGGHIISDEEYMAGLEKKKWGLKRLARHHRLH
nr:hypothetical protein L204_01750 [Cryptococcus depauperatus CBS 7855]